MQKSPFEIARLLARNLPNLILVALLLFVFAPVYQNWSKQNVKEAAELERQAALAQVNTDASIAGSMLWQAYKSCSRIGVPSVPNCANYKGQLLQEMSAPTLAQIALTHRDAYSTSCQRLHAVEYCNSLLNRAFQLSKAAPPSTGAEE